MQTTWTVADLDRDSDFTAAPSRPNWGGEFRVEGFQVRNRDGPGRVHWQALSAAASHTRWSVFIEFLGSLAGKAGKSAKAGKSGKERQASLENDYVGGGVSIAPAGSRALRPARPLGHQPARCEDDRLLLSA